ncbi:hypothetical protein MKX01_038945, partial [Papaver californicum]
MDEHRVSRSTSYVRETEKDSRSLKRDDQPEPEPEHNDGQEEIIGTVPFFKLFRFADFKDKVLMAVGTIGACANGATTPIMTILLGKMINSFGNTEGTDEVVKQVSK